jgi:hypothetical protein
MLNCSKCGQEFKADLGSDLFCPQCKPPAARPKQRSRAWLYCKWLVGGVCLVLVVACLGRETGYYDFHAEHKSSNSTTKYLVQRSGSKPAVRMVRWQEVPGGIRLEYQDGTLGMMQIDEVQYSGLSFLPLYKKFSVEIETSFRSDDGASWGDAEGKLDLTIIGIHSARVARAQARVDLLNAICGAIASERL